MAPRSRTGCLTCRQRKLKCSEERPVCTQCHKASRECVPSSGITFRHQQNPSMNGDPVSRATLKSFYGYKETFGKGSVWVPVPTDLTFVHTNNPYEDEEGATVAGAGETSDVECGRSGGDGAPVSSEGLGVEQNRARYRDAGQNEAGYQDASSGTWSQWERQDARLNTRRESNEVSREERDFAAQLAQAAYPSYATHGLEALSAVASQDQYNYAPPPAPMATQDAPSSQPAVASPQQSNAPISEDPSRAIEANPTSRATPHNIDPRLHSADRTPHQDRPPQSPSQGPPPEHGQYSQPPPTHSPSQVRTNSYHHMRPPSLSLHTKGTRPSAPTICNPELGFLIRDYSERTGYWMDLFDLGRFFSTKVPVLAARCPLLLYSCAALSAKSLARVGGRKPVMNGQISCGHQSRMEDWPGRPLTTEGWVWKARELYDLAVSLLRQALAGASRPSTSALPVETTPETIETSQGAPLPTTDSDELVAATAVLCVYEFLDASGPEWSSHLDGAKSLFEVAEDRMMPLTLPPSPVTLAEQIHQRLTGQSPDVGPRRRTPSKGRIAVFWNFARQDMLSAFINNTSTRLDTADLSMWKSAGLKLNPEGFIYPSNPEQPNYVADNAMQDDMISNALIWLQAKLVNFISAGDNMPDSYGLALPQQDLLDYWNDLDEQLHVWHASLPSSFHAAAVCASESGNDVEEKWFPQSMCASTMQSYHFARIQLLHNKPHITTASHIRIRANSIDPTARLGTPGSSLAARHASYASILKQSRFHAKDIVAIGLGRSDEGTRVHAVQPLWTAGLVLGAEMEGEVSEEVSMWRHLIVRLLRDIERDMGWASEYRVENLLEGWGLERDWGLEWQQK